MQKHQVLKLRNLQNLIDRSIKENPYEDSWVFIFLENDGELMPYVGGKLKAVKYTNNEYTEVVNNLIRGGLKVISATDDITKERTLTICM